MTRRHDAVLGFLVSIAAIGFGGVGCQDNPVGRICDLGTATPQPTETVIASPSLDCVSRTCLREVPNRALPPGAALPPANSGLCTAECSIDSDCDREPESPCITGFTCRIAVDAGPFCCKKFCVCKDYVDTTNEQNDPACNAADMNNQCCNLAGRDNNPAFPQCRS